MMLWGMCRTRAEARRKEARVLVLLWLVVTLLRFWWVRA